MKKIDPQSWKADMPLFREKAIAYAKGEIKKAEYKGFSGRYGSYAQHDPSKNMLRLRMPAGRVTAQKLAYIAEVIRKYNVPRAHFTTCQTIQLHDMDAETTSDIMEGALDVGIVTMGGGGDFPRNTMCAPLSGVSGRRGSPAGMPSSSSACLTGIGFTSQNSASISPISCVCIRPACA